LLGLGWPGGPALERLAANGDAGRYAFPRPMLGRPGCDFSFSGLKTAVAVEVARCGDGALPLGVAADIAASFQRAVADVLADRASRAMAVMRQRAPEARLLVVAGGVAANTTIRAALAKVTEAAGFALVTPPVRLCTDNAVMVAWAGVEHLRLGLMDKLDFAPRPRWGLEELSPTPTDPQQCGERRDDNGPRDLSGPASAAAAEGQVA
jgi:N6-L-threonylcarbamoyladenine synthase